MNSKESFKDLKLPENAIKVNESIKPNKEEKPLIKSKKKKYIIIGGIILGIIIIFVAIFLIVAHFKYNLFGSDIYQVAKVKREVNSIEYFTETKTIKTKMAYTSGELEEIDTLVETDFAVMLTSKEESLNTANLVILKSKTKIKDEEASLNSFNIFDEKVVKKKVF